MNTARLSPIRSGLDRLIGSSAVRWFAMLGLCAAYLQGGVNKALDFPAALAEMRHFGLSPAAPLTIAVIMVELGASAAILLNIKRWLAALVLAGFTLMATFVANPFWALAGQERFAAANSFFEHVGLVGGLVLLGWFDLNEGR